LQNAKNMNNDILSQLRQWCNKAERCRADFRLRAQKLGVDTIEAEIILDRLEKEGWLNELRFAKAYVHDKSVIAKWPEKRIRLSLKIKGIEAEILQQAMEEEYSLDESKEIQRYIARKLENQKQTDRRKTYAALYRYLMGKGFHSEKIAAAIRAYGEDSESI